jgi:hypothetical protein
MQEVASKKADEARIKDLVEQEKARLLAEHQAILLKHHPKAFARSGF